MYVATTLCLPNRMAALLSQGEQVQVVIGFDTGLTRRSFADAFVVGNELLNITNSLIDIALFHVVCVMVQMRFDTIQPVEPTAHVCKSALNAAVIG